MSGYVVCRSCGTRIKAGREFCLKCFEPLPEPGAAEPTTPWVSLGWSPMQQAALAIASAVVVIGLIAVIWNTQSAPTEDEARPAARPANAAAAQSNPSVPAPATAPALAGPGAIEPFSPTPIAAAPARTEEADTAALEARRAELDQQLEQRPDDSYVLNRKGQVLERLGRVREAMTCFERAVALAPDTPTYHFNLARAEVTFGQWDRAITEYREVVRLQPNDYAARYTLGMSLQRKGDDEAAILELQKAVAVGPGEAGGHLALGVSLERAGRTPEAVHEYERYLAVQPGSADSERLKLHLDAVRARSQVK